MMQHTLMDTGPLVACINRRDKHHLWARDLLGQLCPPILTCDAVLAEACFLLRGMHGGNAALLELVRRGVLQPEFHLIEHVSSVATLMDKYANVPMALADACLVRMSEIYDNSRVITLDSDFHVYRRNGRQAIPLCMPPQ
ncbi:MAG: PIN domain-containing protein [Lentisphaeria bacterium]|nr:PIN domain-containing protein [Lentisphaeria bacterium]